MTDEHETPYTKLVGAWTGFIIVSVIMLALFRTAWWIIFPIIGTLSGAIKETQSYLHSHKICPKCGQKIEPEIKFCPKCGFALPQNCPKCGQPFSAKGKFCDKCGFDITAGSNPTENKMMNASGVSGSPSMLAAESKEDKKPQRFCSSCGSELPVDAKVCPVCGLSE